MANEYRDFNHAMLEKYGIGFESKLTDEEREEYQRLKQEAEGKRQWLNRKVKRYYDEKRSNMSNEAKLYSEPNYLNATESVRGIHKVK